MFSFSNSAPTGALIDADTSSFGTRPRQQMFPLTKGVQIVRTSMMGQVWSVSCWTTGFGFSCWVLVSLVDECLKYYRDCLRFSKVVMSCKISFWSFMQPCIRAFAPRSLVVVLLLLVLLAVKSRRALQASVAPFLEVTNCSPQTNHGE